jgi:flagellar motor switch protein FliG
MGKLKSKEITRQHDLTIDEVKACKIFQHLSDEQAAEVAATLKDFTVIIYNFYVNNVQKL